MLMLKSSGILMAITGVGLFVAAGQVDEAAGSLRVTGVVLVVAGIGMFVLAKLLDPVMRSSKELAEQRGMKVSRLTGAPTMRSAMEQANQTMAQSQERMQTLMGGARLRAGLPGEAIVRAARDTGQRQNLNPVFEVDLTVTPQNDRAYEVTVRTEVSTLAVAQCVPSTRVPVKIDPDDRQQIWIDWMAVAGGATT